MRPRNRVDASDSVVTCAPAYSWLSPFDCVRQNRTAVRKGFAFRTPLSVAGMHRFDCQSPIGDDPSVTGVCVSGRPERFETSGQNGPGERSRFPAFRATRPVRPACDGDGSHFHAVESDVAASDSCESPKESEPAKQGEHLAAQARRAERAGFEPAVPLIGTHRISNPALSAAQPSLRSPQCPGTDYRFHPRERKTCGRWDSLAPRPPRSANAAAARRRAARSGPFGWATTPASTVESRSSRTGG